MDSIQTNSRSVNSQLSPALSLRIIERFSLIPGHPCYLQIILKRTRFQHPNTITAMFDCVRSTSLSTTELRPLRTFMGLLIPVFCLISSLTFAAPANAGETDDPASVLPRHQRLESITKPAAFFGFQIGSRHLRHDQISDYMKQLAAESDRVELLPYATSHGGRTLFVLAITSPQNLQKIKSIKSDRKELASGKIKSPRKQDVSVMYFGYSVHGDEASGMNAAPLLAYHLASSLSKDVINSLEQSVLLVDPSLNPDGGSRFAHWVNENRGKLASTNPLDREHQQNWPGGRTNYYWFDLNRDWLPVTHPESQGRLKLFHEWKPNVVLDFHEMGSSSSYFFQPGIPARTNPLTPTRNVELTKLFALAHAKKLDDAGELFFTEERFDDFYIGKGSTYPDLNGAVGILFEQGSSRGLNVKTRRTERSFTDSVANQLRTSLSSLSTLRDLSTELLQFQCDFFHSARKQGRKGSSYLLFGERSRINEAKRLLNLHDIKIHQPTIATMLDDSIQATDVALLIPGDQPQSTLIRSMMSTRQDFKENIFYDVSAWHLPTALDLQVKELDARRTEALISSARTEKTGKAASAPDFNRQYAGFAVKPDSLQFPTLIALLQRQKANLRVTTQPIELSTRNGLVRYPQGTLLMLRQPNLANWKQLVKALRDFSSDAAIEILPVTSSLTPKGPDLGSDTTLDMVTANPALIVGAGTNAYTAGSLWHHLDVRIKQPTTLIDTVNFTAANLQDYSVVILPDGKYGLWHAAHATKLRQYLEGGGVVIAVCNSVDWLKNNGVIKMATPKHQDETDGSSTSRATNESPKKRFGDARNDAALESIAGAMFRTEIDSTHPLSYGFPNDTVPVFRRGTYTYTPPENSYQTAAIYGDVIAGYVSEKNRKHLKGTAAVFTVPVGKGHVIVLCDNPVFRGYIRSTEPFFTNAVYLGPSFKIPGTSTDEHEH